MAIPQKVPPRHSSHQGLGTAMMGWLNLNSFGGRLFWMIMLGALAGVGAMAFLFSEMIKYQAEDQVRRSLDGKVNAISSVTEAAETLAYGLGVSTTTLHDRGAQVPDTYRELTFQLFERRPDFVVGLGVGQRENGIIVNQPWLFPYYWVTPPQDGSPISQAPIRYENFADDIGEFYPDTEQFRDYFLTQLNTWTEPYQKANNELLTYYLPMFNNSGGWVGTTLVDIDVQYLSDLISAPVFRQQGHYILMTRSGTVIADPADTALNLQSYQEIPDLGSLWPQVNVTSNGFLEGETGYWAYASVPGQNWLVFGYVPYRAVFGRIALITIAAALLIATLMAGVIWFAIRGLNRRLKPVFNQCNQLAQTDDGLLAQWDQHDELEQLSLSFFNMLEQLNLNRKTIRRHQQEIKKETLHADQVSDQFVTFIDQMGQEAGEQQGLIHQVQTLMAGISNDSQSLDIQLDAMSTLGRALDGELKRSTPEDVDVLEALTALEQHLCDLLTSVEADENVQARRQSMQSLIMQLGADVAILKAIEQRRPSTDNLREQIGNISHTGQTAANGSRAVLVAVQSIAQTLTKIEKISTTWVRKAKSISS